jgi:hypothetical protein
MHWLNAEEIRELLPRCDSRTFDPELYKKTGYFVLRQAIPPDVIIKWQVAWQNFRNQHLNGGRQLDGSNPVSVQETESILESCSKDVAAFLEIIRSPHLLDLAEKIYGPDFGVYYWRFLMKDQHARKPVFLHQDFGYNIGWPDKTSFLIPFTQANAENGGMIFCPGTHAYGYLGNAGTIAADKFGDWPQVCPDIMPGDIVFMHCLTWHASGVHASGVDRVMMQVVYQPADDPSTQTLVRGEWKTNVFFDLKRRQEYFTRSYITQLVTLYSELGDMKGKIEKLMAG